MSKRLPRTSPRTLDDLRKAASEALDAEKASLKSVPDEGQTPARERTAKQRQETNADGTDAMQPSQEKTAANGFEREEPARAARGESASRSASPPGRSLASAQTERPDRDAFRKASARLIVERHSNIAALAGLVPMPWIDLAAITVTVDAMLRKLARLYGEPLERHSSRRLATAMLTGMAAPGIASFATTGLLRMTPGPHLLGMAVTSVSAAVIVRAIGEVYLSHLTGENPLSQEAADEASPC